MTVTMMKADEMCRQRGAKALFLPAMAVMGLLAAAVPADARAADGIVWHEQQRSGYAVGPERVSVEEYTEYRTRAPQGPTAGQPVRVEASAPPPLPYKPYPETELWRSGGYVASQSSQQSSGVRQARSKSHKKHAVAQSKNCNCAKVGSKAHGAKAATRTATAAPAESHKQKLAGVAQHQRLKAVKMAQNSQVRMQRSYSVAGAVPVTVVTPDNRVPALVRPAAQAATIVRNNAGDPGAPGWESRTRTVTTVQDAPVAWREQRAVSYVDYGAQPAVWGGPIYLGQGR